MTRDKKVEVVAFNSKEAYSELELFQIARNELSKRQGKAIILVFPETALGEKVMSREQIRVFLVRLHNLLARHGNAFIFFSLLRKIRTKNLPLINAGYIVTPDKKKKWLSYPKVANWSGEVTDFDKSILERVMGIETWSERSKRSKLAPVMRTWVEASRKLVRDFPSVFVNGTQFQLRVCADSCRHVGLRDTLQDGAHKPGVILVPAKNLADNDRGFAEWPGKMGEKSTMVVVDGAKRNTRVLMNGSVIPKIYLT
ncbi:MAG: hypothetical protein WCW13_06705, partial [archaeon]